MPTKNKKAPASQTTPAATASGVSVIKLPLLQALACHCSAMLLPGENIGFRRVKDGRYACRVTARGLFQTAWKPRAFGSVMDLSYTVRTLHEGKTSRYYSGRRAVLKAICRQGGAWELVHLPKVQPRLAISFTPTKGGAL